MKNVRGGERMKKLNKKFRKNENTVETYDTLCGCGCMCSYCAATWESQYDWNSENLFKDARDA